jgi:2-phosphosulfolactate phosphatase
MYHAFFSLHPAPRIPHLLPPQPAMAQHIVNVHKLPSDIPPGELAGSTVVVIDLLRATSTICQALASGANEVVPLLEVADAVAAALNLGREGVVLGGERGGGKIAGFDLGNSPTEYTPAAVAGKRVLLTTTNGTRALHHARQARRVVAGALVNLSAVIESIQNEPRVDVLCAGTDGRESREDILAAGAIVDGLWWKNPDACQMNKNAEAARAEWVYAVVSAGVAGRTLADQLAIELRDTPGGQNLLSIGLDADLIACSRVDALGVVPEFDRAAGRICLAQGH